VDIIQKGIAETPFSLNHCLPSPVKLLGLKIKYIYHPHRVNTCNPLIRGAAQQTLNKVKAKSFLKMKMKEA